MFGVIISKFMCGWKDVRCTFYDFSPYEMKKNYIDTDLLSNRHGIVHGEKRFISIEDFDGTLYQVMEIMDSVRDQILDAAINKDYKK